MQLGGSKNSNGMEALLNFNLRQISDGSESCVPTSSAMKASRGHLQQAITVAGTMSRAFQKQLMWYSRARNINRNKDCAIYRPRIFVSLTDITSTFSNI